MAKENDIPSWDDTEEVIPTWEDTQEYTRKEKPSKLESLGGGIQQGGTLGFSDELSGATEVGADLVHSLLNKLGVVDTPSVSQVNRQLQKEGVSGDVGPTSRGDLYSEARDTERARLKELQEANPMSYLAGEVAGGIPTTVATAGALSPMKAAEGAGVLAKMGTAAANSVLPGAVVGAGLSEGKTAGEVTLDTLTGAGIGGLAGGALNLGGQGIGAAVRQGSKLIPQSAKNAFERGLQGVDTTSDEFYDVVTNTARKRAEDIAEASGVGTPGPNEMLRSEAREGLQQSKQALKDLKDSRSMQIDQETQNLVNKQVAETERRNALIQKLKEQQQAEQQRLAAQQNQTKAKMDDLVNLDNQRKEVEALQQSAVSKEELLNTQREGNKLLKNMKSKLSDTKKTLGKNYDEIDSAAEQLGVFADTKNAISSLEQSLSMVDEATAGSVMKKVTGYLETKQGPKKFRELKRVLNNLSEGHDSPTVRQAARNAERILRDDYTQALAQKNPELAKRLADNNYKWGLTRDLEESYIGSLNPDRFLDEQSIDKGLGTFGSFKRGSMKDVNVADTFEEKLKQLSPEAAEEFIPMIQQNLQQQGGISSAKPQFIENPEIARLQGLLDSLKGQGRNVSTPEILQTKEQLGASQRTASDLKKLLNELRQRKKQTTPEISAAELQQEDARAALEMAKMLGDDTVEVLGTTNPENLINKTLSDMPKAGMQTGSDVAERNLRELEGAVQNFSGQQRASELMSDLPELAKDLQIRNRTSKDATSESISGLADRVVEATLGGATRMGNKLGRMLRPFAGKETTLNGGLSSLSNASKEEQAMLITELSQLDKFGVDFSKSLANAYNKTGAGRDAILYGLMQRPEFRERMRKLATQSGNENTDVEE